MLCYPPRNDDECSCQFQLRVQAGDKITFAPTLKLIDRHMIDTTGSNLVVFKVRCDNVKSTHSLVRMASSPSSLKEGSHRTKNEATKYLTLPACVVDYAFPDEAARFTSQSTEVVYDHI